MYLWGGRTVTLTTPIGTTFSANVGSMKAWDEFLFWLNLGKPNYLFKEHFYNSVLLKWTSQSMEGHFKLFYSHFFLELQTWNIRSRKNVLMITIWKAPNLCCKIVIFIYQHHLTERLWKGPPGFFILSNKAPKNNNLQRLLSDSVRTQGAGMRSEADGKKIWKNAENAEKCGKNTV